jgi:hypothetical protein
VGADPAGAVELPGGIDGRVPADDGAVLGDEEEDGRGGDRFAVLVEAGDLEPPVLAPSMLNTVPVGVPLAPSRSPGAGMLTTRVWMIGFPGAGLGL